MHFDSIQDLSFLDKKTNSSGTSPGESKSRKRAFSLVGCDLPTIAKEISYMWGLGASESACTNVSILLQFHTFAFVVVFLTFSLRNVCSDFVLNQFTCFIVHVYENDVFLIKYCTGFLLSYGHVCCTTTSYLLPTKISR